MDPLPVDNQGTLVGEARIPKEHIDTIRLQPVGRIVPRDRGAPLPHAPHHGAEVDGYPIGGYAQTRRATDVTDSAGRTKNRFRGNAAGIEAVAAEQVSFDERDACAEACGAHRADQTGGAATDNHKIVLGGWLRVPPGRRMHSSHELFVRLIGRRNQASAGRGIE
jgi:hypothetical protein